MPIKPAAPELDTSSYPYCERMHLWQLPLPCGEREECNGCPQNPRKAKRGEKLCLRCGGAFKPSSPAQKYCSKRCQDAARKEDDASHFRQTQKKAAK